MKSIVNPGRLILPLILAVLVSGSLGAQVYRPGADRLDVQKADKAVVVPSRYLRGYDPVTVFYPEDLGPRQGGPADGPSEFLALQPGLAGEYRWIDARTIQFLPAVPWPALKNFTVTGRGFRTGLSTMLVPPSGLNPAAGSAMLENLDSLTLVFPSALDRDSLKDMMSFEIRDLPGLDPSTARSIEASRWSLRELEASRSATSSAFRVDFREAIPYGKRLILTLRLSPDPSIPDALARFTFDTRPEFRIIGVGSGSLRLPVNQQGSRYSQDQALDCGTAGNPLWVEFSEGVMGADMETIKRMVRFTPSVRNLRTEWSGNRLVLRFDADRDTAYRMDLSWQGIVSAGKRTLAPFGDSSLYFWFRQSSPYINWRLSQGIVERYGPQVLPMEGRGLERLDLRVHRIDGSDPDFFPYPASPVVIDENSRPPMPGEEPGKGTDLAGRLRLLSSPDISKVVTLPINAGSPRTRFGLDLRGELAQVFGKEVPGTYLVGYRVLGAGSLRNWVRVTVTDLCLSAVEEEDSVNFVVTSFRDGSPVQGARIRLEYSAEENGQRNYVELNSGSTDQSGQYRYLLRSPLKYRPDRVVIEKDNDRVVVSTADTPPVFSDNHWFQGEHNWLGWLADERRQERHDGQTLAWLLSERPIYRPGETIHFLGWVRERRDGLIREARPDEDLELYITVDEKEWIKPVRLQDNGRFALDFADSADITGEFHASLRGRKTGTVWSSMSFRKDAYRIPEFELNILGPDRVPVDRPFDLTLVADYYAGGRVVGQQVLWEQTPYAYSIRSPDWEGFVFSSDERFQGNQSFQDGSVVNQSMVLDENGSAVLRIDPTLEGDGRARRYVVEATVQGADSQTVTTVRQVLALPPFSIGIRLKRFHPDSSSIKPSLVVLDHKLESLGGLKVSARLIQRQWHSFITQTDISTGEAKYVSDTVDKVLEERNVVSSKDAQDLEFRIPEPGVYLVEFSALDAMGRRVSVRTDTFVSGSGPQTWERKTAGIFEVQPDQDSYKPGETARLILKSPWQEARALVVMENADGNEYTWVPVSKGVGIFNFRVKPNMIPSVPVSVLLMRGRVQDQERKDGSLVDLGKPATLGASLMVNIQPVSNQAVLTLSHAAKAAPGTDLTMDLLVRDPDGKPLDGWVSLWLVDRAILSLAQEAPLNPLDHFITSVRSWLRMSDMRNLVLGFIPIEEIPGGDGEEKAEAMAMFNRTTVRSNFQTVPYFNPAIPVKDGKARITIKLPDNLTEFVVRGIASSGYDRFGVARSQVAIRLPVIVQSAFPRFLRPGDSFSAGATVRVVEGEGGPGLAGVKATGFTLDQARAEGTSGQDGAWTKKITLPAKEALRVDFPWTVPMGGKGGKDSQAELTMFVQRDSDKAQDAFRMVLPVMDGTGIRKQVKVVEAQASQTMEFPVPEVPAEPGTLERRLVVSQDLRLLRLLQAWEYLDRYSHGCLEQRMARLYPGIFLTDAAKKLGLELQAVSPGVMADFWSYMDSCQDSEGLYAFWPGGSGSVFLTAYALEFSAQVEAARYPVALKARDRGIAALKMALRSDYGRLLSAWSDYERVEALIALDKNGDWEEGYANQLLDLSPRLPLYSQARLLALYVRKNLKNLPKVQALATRLESSIITKLEGKQVLFAGLQEKDGAYGGPVLGSDIRTLSAMITGLGAWGSDAKNINLLYQALLDKSGESGWGSTVDNTAVFQAMKAILSLPALPVFGRDVSLVVDGKSQSLSLGMSRIASFKVPDGKTVQTVYKSGSGVQTPVYFLLYTQYKAAGKSSGLPASAKGMVVGRDLMLVGKDNSLGKRFVADARNPAVLGVGDIVEDHVNLVLPDTVRYLALTVPLAAGLEPLNPDLATSPPEARPSGTMSVKPSYSLYLDDRVVWYFDSLPKGSFDFYFRTRASFAGTWSQPPARSELMYKDTVWGMSSGMEVQIKP